MDLTDLEKQVQSPAPPSKAEIQTSLKRKRPLKRKDACQCAAELVC